MRTSTAVAIDCEKEGDVVLRKALRALAASKGLDAKDIVRQGVDEKWGDELQPHIDFFAAQIGTKKFQDEQKKVTV